MKVHQKITQWCPVGAMINNSIRKAGVILAQVHGTCKLNTGTTPSITELSIEDYLKLKGSVPGK